MTDWTKDITGVDVSAHKTRHQNAGADEIAVTALSGLLADDQHVLDAEVLAVAAALVHATRHTDGNDDIQSATAAQKGLATAAEITKLDGIEASAVALATVKADSDIADAISKKHSHTPGAHEPDPSGGGVVDTEARATIVSLLAKLEALGFLNSS